MPTGKKQARATGSDYELQVNVFASNFQIRMGLQTLKRNSNISIHPFSIPACPKQGRGGPEPNPGAMVAISFNINLVDALIQSNVLFCESIQPLQQLGGGELTQGPSSEITLPTLGFEPVTFPLSLNPYSTPILKAVYCIQTGINSRMLHTVNEMCLLNIPELLP